MRPADLDRQSKERSGQGATQPHELSCGHSAVWAGFIFALVLSILAFSTHAPAALAWVTAANGVLLIFKRPGRVFLRRAAKTLIWQTGIITGLYGLRFGLSEGLTAGLTISWQLFLAFLPGAIFVQTTAGHRILQMLADVMPYRMAFVLSTCLNYIPLLLGEVKSIYEGQALRGARILPKDLVNPRNWLDVIHCLVVPTIIQSMKLAGEIALAARARDFGVMKCRTFWPGDQGKMKSRFRGKAEKGVI